MRPLTSIDAVCQPPYTTDVERQTRTQHLATTGAVRVCAALEAPSVHEGRTLTHVFTHCRQIGHGALVPSKSRAQLMHAHRCPQGTARWSLSPTKQSEHVVVPPTVDSGSTPRAWSIWGISVNPSTPPASSPPPSPVRVRASSTTPTSGASPCSAVRPTRRRFPGLIAEKGRWKRRRRLRPTCAVPAASPVFAAAAAAWRSSGRSMSTSTSTSISSLALLLLLLLLLLRPMRCSSGC